MLKPRIFNCSTIHGAFNSITLGVAALIGLAAAPVAAVQAQGVDSIMQSVRAAPANDFGLSHVRKDALREAAMQVGAQQGMIEQSCVIDGELRAQEANFDRKYRFNELMMGPGILPPVISEVRNSVSLDDTVMRVASRVYTLDEPARVVDMAPTWRDWIYVGLSAEDCNARVVDSLASSVRPRNGNEEAYFRQVLEQSYPAGREQAKEILSENLSRLERSYMGMRMYYELFARGLVSAPQIAKATEAVDMSDPNTLVLGNTIIRINLPSTFQGDMAKWKSLDSKPSGNPSQALKPLKAGTAAQPIPGQVTGNKARGSAQ